MSYDIIAASNLNVTNKLLTEILTELRTANERTTPPPPAPPAPPAPKPSIADTATPSAQARQLALETLKDAVATARTKAVTRSHDPVEAFMVTINQGGDRTSSTAVDTRNPQSELRARVAATAGLRAAIVWADPCVVRGHSSTAIWVEASDAGGASIVYAQPYTHTPDGLTLDCEPIVFRYGLPLL